MSCRGALYLFGKKCVKFVIVTPDSILKAVVYLRIAVVQLCVPDVQ